MRDMRKNWKQGTSRRRSSIITPHTAKNVGKKICPFLENEDFRRFEKKNAHFEKKILIFKKRTDYFLGIFCSVPRKG